MKYTKSDLVRDLAEVAGSQLAAKAFIAEAITIITDQVSQGNAVDIAGLMKIESKLQKGRSGIVPGTKSKTYSTSDKMVPRASFAQAFRQKVATTQGK